MYVCSQFNIGFGEVVMYMAKHRLETLPKSMAVTMSIM
jgi:hypothetical protein